MTDPVTGIVDFPAILGGDRVWLCWQMGEPEVRFWHAVSVGIRTASSGAGRSSERVFVNRWWSFTDAGMTALIWVLGCWAELSAIGEEE